MNLSELFERIVVEGKSKGMTQAQVAKRAGMLPASISRMNAVGNAHFSNVAALAAAVGLELILVPNNEIARGLAAGNLFED